MSEQKLSQFIVTEKAMRPVSRERQCFYCQQPIGAYHKVDCVLIDKRVKIRMTVEYEVDVPAHWDADMIEFHRNESSWCADTAIHELDRMFNGASESPCMCECSTFEYLEDTSEPFLREGGILYGDIDHEDMEAKDDSEFVN